MLAVLLLVIVLVLCVVGACWEARSPEWKAFLAVERVRVARGFGANPFDCSGYIAHTFPRVSPREAAEKAAALALSGYAERGDLISGFEFYNEPNVGVFSRGPSGHIGFVGPRGQWVDPSYRPLTLGRKTGHTRADAMEAAFRKAIDEGY